MTLTAAKARRGFSPARDLPVLFWLVALLGAALVDPFLPVPRWLLIHLLLLGAITHSILVWSRHFTETLLHTASTDADHRQQLARLALLNVGVLTVVVGVVGARWPVTILGAAGVSAAAGWHGIALLRELRRALPARFGAIVRYYIAAAALLPIGALLGVLLARGLGDPWRVQVMIAHAAVNLLGWVGLTILGTLVTLWPTMLRTRIADGAERAARRALPVLIGGVVATAGAALLGLLPLVPAGLLVYLAGLGLLVRPFLKVVRAKPPTAFPTWSVLAGLAWLVGSLLALVAALATATSWEVAQGRFQWITPALAAGFAAQILLGALSYLLPVSLGGGPSPTRAANAVLDRGGVLRIVLVNGGLVTGLLPVPDTVRVLSAMLVLGGLAAFIPLLILAIRACRKAKAEVEAAEAVPAEAASATRPRGPAPVGADRPRGQLTGLAATGLAAVVLAVAAGVALDPSALSGAGATESVTTGVAATGQVTRVTVEAKDMRFAPSLINVPVGNRLVIDLRNTDDQNVHDLVLDNGTGSRRLSSGESTQIDVGVVGRDIAGWCSVVGHRQLGMVLTIKAMGALPPAGTGEGPAPTPGTGGPAPNVDFLAQPGPGFHPHNAVLPPLEAGRVHRLTLTVTELEHAVAPDVRQRLWTYNGSSPGPMLHGRVGDRFVVRLVNDGTMGHSIDFHAGALAPDRPMRTIPPGESLVYQFTATRAGIWMYHCSSMPMSAHIANGLFGAVVIDPPDLPRVDRSYLLVQSELYLGPQGGVVDVGKLRAEQPSAVVFNGYANQYDHAPLTAKVGERVRIWVLDAGPNRSTAFHVVGGQFDRAYAEGSYLLDGGRGGSQALTLGPAQGGFVELTFPEPGHYPFLSHVMVDAERGAHGLFRVTR